MSKVVKHIGLQVVEHDIMPFYEEVLGFASKRSFVLDEAESKRIFSISKSVQIIYGTIGENEFELFASKSPKCHSYNHVCIHVSDADQMAKRAEDRGYKVYKRKGNESDTFFLSDSNGNTYELKSL